LKSDYEFLKGIDQLTADVYQAKVIDKLEYPELVKKFNIPPSEVYTRSTLAKRILIEGDFTWMTGLSTYAVTQLLKTDYTDADSLKHDVLNNIIDLENLPNIGHKIAQEIHTWCLNHKSKYSHDRRVTDRRKTNN
jgi:hypothetical protein